MTDMFEKQLEMSFRAKMLAGKLMQSENERLAEPCWNCGNGTGFVNSQFAVVCDSCYALHSQNANCRTCGYLKDISARKVAA